MTPGVFFEFAEGRISAEADDLRVYKILPKKQRFQLYYYSFTN